MTRAASLILFAVPTLLALSGCASSPAHPEAQGPSTEPAARVLRISADPNNLPFTNDRLEGFENKIAQLVADDLHAGVEYHWRAQRRGFFRHALKEDECDVVLGVPSRFERALPTTPYYRSTYCVVTRADRNLGDLRALDDPRLRGLKIGVQVIGDDGASTPPAHALARRGIVQNIVGYSVIGDYRDANPPARIMDAVAKGEVDVAIVWGPLAGYFAGKQPVKLNVVPLTDEADPASGLPFAFDISMGCRNPDKALRDEINAVIARRRPEIERILDEYKVPRLAIHAESAAARDDKDGDDEHHHH
jgi:quinoprotein dehydrogenase-associated probable ABC transporter substrate-binding protein